MAGSQGRRIRRVAHPTEGHTEVWYCEDGRSVTATWRNGKWDVVPNP